VIKCLDDIGTEQETCTSRAQTPAVDFVWVGPEEVAHGAFVGNFLFAVEEANFIHAVDEGGETTMYAQDGARVVAPGAVGGRCGACASGADA
jgi:hypothetical protein